MDRAMFANFNSHRISLKEAKQILNRNGNAYSDEDVKKIVDYLYVLAELAVEYAENQNRKNLEKSAPIDSLTERPKLRFIGVDTTR